VAKITRHISIPTLRTVRLLIIRLILLGTIERLTPERIRLNVCILNELRPANNIFWLTSALSYYARWSNMDQHLAAWELDRSDSRTVSCLRQVYEQRRCIGEPRWTYRAPHSRSIGFTLHFSCLMYLEAAKLVCWRHKWTDWTIIEPDMTTCSVQWSLTEDSISEHFDVTQLCAAWTNRPRYRRLRKFCHVYERCSIDIERWRNTNQFTQVVNAEKVCTL